MNYRFAAATGAAAPIAAAHLGTVRQRGTVAGSSHSDLETRGGAEMQVTQEGPIRVARPHDQADARAEIAPATEDAADSAPFRSLRTDFPKPFPSVWENRLKLKENQNDRKAAGAP